MLAVEPKDIEIGFVFSFVGTENEKAAEVVGAVAVVVSELVLSFEVSFDFA